jgi:hypothetical protein
MLLNFAIFSPNTSSDPLATRQSPSLYPADRLTEMQSILAALADLETAYEIDREPSRLSVQGTRAEWCSGVSVWAESGIVGHRV